jgi:DNA-binding LacI/PurR family transcriptional regulator
MHNHDQPTPLVRHVQNFDRAVEIIKQERGKITVVALNNEFAAKLIDKCVLAELRIPEDYQLIAFDDNPLYRSYNLTSLGFPMEEVGKVFGRMICDKSLLQDYRGKVSVKLNSKLIKRETLKLNITT